MLNWEWLLRHALFPGDFSPASLALLRLAMRALLSHTACDALLLPVEQSG